jgi:hypothetical protein
MGIVQGFSGLMAARIFLAIAEVSCPFVHSVPDERS